MKNYSQTPGQTARLNVIAILLLTILMLSSVPSYGGAVTQIVQKADPGLAKTVPLQPSSPLLSWAFSSTGVAAYVPITITNMQPQSISSGFQQLINVNFSAFSSYLNSVAENIQFYDSSWNPLNAWIQTNAFCPTCVSSIWVKLSQAIPAYGAITI